MTKNIAIVCVLILVAGGIYAYYANDPAFKLQQLPSYAAGQPQSGAPTTGKHAVNWKFETVQQAGNEGQAQKTKVTVTWDGTSHDAGTYEGTCAEIDGTNGTLTEGEVSGALCWFAGAGDEIGVFNQNGTFVLKHGEQQEPAGEGEAFRGNFTTILSL